MLTDKYSYRITELADKIIWVSLYELEGQKRSLNFKMVKLRDDNSGIIKHMESLTDANCEQWFPKEKKQKQK